MRRRDFMTLLGGAAAAWPLAARSDFSATLTTTAFDHSSLRWLEIST